MTTNANMHYRCFTLLYERSELRASFSIKIDALIPPAVLDNRAASRVHLLKPPLWAAFLLESSMSEADVSIAADLLHGIDEIAAFIGETRFSTRALLEGHKIPATRDGRVWKMRKSSYCRFIQARESALIGKTMQHAA